MWRGHAPHEASDRGPDRPSASRRPLRDRLPPARGV